MSNLLQSILASQGGAVINQIAKNFGLDPQTAQLAVEKLMPAVSRGIQQNSRQQGGLEQLLGLVTGGSTSQYAEQPEQLNSQNAISDGNNILGQIFGSKEVSRNVAGHAAKETGLDIGILKKILPLLASASIGSIGQQAQQEGSSLGAAANQKPADIDLGMLSSFLDADKDGSVMDDVLKLAQRFI